MNTARRKKLRLTRETLRALSNAVLARAAGGDADTCDPRFCLPCDSIPSDLCPPTLVLPCVVTITSVERNALGAGETAPLSV